MHVPVASNVTGILSDTRAISVALHRFGALSFWDFAAAAPYVEIEMAPRRLGEDADLDYKDAIFLSPHTGFGTAALAVGTPWLTLSGGPWHESLFNGVPFHSVLPDVERYPCFTGRGAPPGPVEYDGPRTPSMTRARIEEDLPELLEAARPLVERRVAYDDARARYFSRLLAAYGGDRSRIFSIENIHERYI